MKVNIYSRYFLPSIGGTEQTSFYLAQALSESGFTVNLFTETLLKENDTEIKADFRIIRKKKIPLFWELLKESFTNCILISKGGIALIPILTKIISCRKLVIYHEMNGDSLSLRHAKGFLDKFKLIFKKKILLSLANVHIAVSKECLNSIPIKKNKPQFYIYNCINPELEKYKNITCKKTIDVLFVGRIISLKGIFILAEALRILKKKNIQLNPLFIGNGSEKQELTERLIQIGYNKECYFGPSKGEELATKFAASKIVIVPTTAHPEGMGMVIAEAFAFGLPVIASNILVFEEVVGNAGLVFENGNALDLANKIEYLLGSEEIYLNLSKAAGERSTIFSYNKFKDKVNKVFKTL